MHATSATASQQQKRLRAHKANCDSDSFFNLLTSDALLDTVESLLPAGHRERLYPPTETLSMFLAQSMSADRSCQHVVNQAALQRLGHGLTPGSARTGGYCQARGRLPLEMIFSLTRELGAGMDQHVPDAWRWQGRRVRIVDGTTLTMPDTAANQAKYPQQRRQLPGVGFPICRVVGVTCLASGALLNAAIGRYHGKGGDEQTLLRSIQDTFHAGDVVLGDALFASYFFIATMQARGVDVLMEQHGARKGSADFRRGRRLGTRDHVIVINKPKNRPKWMSEADFAAAPATLTLREFKSGGKLIITTLLNPTEAPRKALAALYRSRWEIELDLRHLKDTLGMGVLSCKTPAMIEKEIWAYLLAYNLIRLMMAQSALLADITPRTISFKHCMQLWTLWVQQLDMLDDDQLGKLLELIAQQRVGQRPGRIEPRAVKRRPKPFPFLTRPRAMAREAVRAHGHPKKRRA